MAREVQILLENVYIKILNEGGSGEALTSHLYQFNGYYEALAAIQDKLITMGINEQSYFEKELSELYVANSKRIGKQFNLPFDVSDSDIKKALTSVWAPDKMNWSQRIWKHEGQLLNKLSNTLVDAVALGINPDKLVENIMLDFGVSFRNAQRLVVTECNYIMNQSCADAAQDAGCNDYIYLGDQSGACDECAELNGQRFSFGNASVGVNFPPRHPNCRCSILPVIE